MFRDDKTLKIENALALYEQVKETLESNTNSEKSQYTMDEVKAIGLEDIQEQIKRELEANDFALMNIDILFAEDYRALENYIDNFDLGVESKKKENWQEKQKRLENEGKCAVVLQAMKGILPALLQQQHQQQQQIELAFIHQLKTKLDDEKWDTMGTGFLESKVPKGIEKLRKILKNDDNKKSHEIIEDLKKIATKRLGKIRIREGDITNLYEEIINFGAKTTKNTIDDIGQYIKSSGRYGR